MNEDQFLAHIIAERDELKAQLDAKREAKRLAQARWRAKRKEAK